MGKKPKGFNNPFADIGKQVKIPPPAPKKAPEVAKPAEKPIRDEDLFADEMMGVAPLAPDPRGRLGAPPPSPRPKISQRQKDEAEAYAQLADLVEGAGTFDISDSDEYIEGIAP